MGKGRAPNARGSRKTKKFFRAVPNAEARQVVQWFRDCGAPIHEIVRKTGLTQDFVFRWWHRDDTDTAEGRGLKAVCSEKQRQKLAKAICKVRFGSAAKIRHLVRNPKTRKPISESTVRRELEKAGLISRKVRKGQILTADQKKYRLAWAETMKRKYKGMFRNWIFSDEKWWCVGGVQGNERMWVLKEDPNPDELFVPIAAHPVKVHIWAAISYDGRSSMHIHDGRINSKVYCECIKDAFLPCLYEKDYLALKKKQKYVFMQDGASCHMSKYSWAWLEKNLPQHVAHHERGEWPASSPDLNPVENLWAILQDRVIERRAYSYDALVKVVVEEWWKISQQTIRNLFDSMPKRLDSCIRVQGGRWKSK